MMKYNKFRPIIKQPDDPTYKLIPLTRGQITMVDTEDYEVLMQWNWFAARIRKTDVYYAARFDESRKMVYMHRVLLGDDFPETDHRERNTLDNRKDELRKCTRSQNQSNRTLSRRNTSGFKGVSWSKQNKKWQAATSVKGKHIHLGFRDTPEEAHKLYSEFVVKIKGEFARV